MHRHNAKTGEERHAGVCQQVSGPDQWSAEWVRPARISGLAAVAELQLLGSEIGSGGGTGHGAVPLPQPSAVQGLPGLCEAPEPSGERRKHEAIAPTGKAGDLRA